MEPNATRRPNGLNAASWISQLENNKPRMRQILDELQKLHSRLRHIKHMAEMARVVAGANAVLGSVLVALVAAVLYRFQTLLDSDAFLPLKACAALFILCVLAFAVMFILAEDQRKVEEESLGKLSEFRAIVASLNNELEDVKSSCAECRRGTTGAEALELIRLEISILELFAVSAGLRTSVTAQRMTETLIHCGTVVDEFEKMKERLQPPNDPSSRRGGDRQEKAFNLFNLFT